MSFTTCGHHCQRIPIPWSGPRLYRNTQLVEFWRTTAPSIVGVYVSNDLFLWSDHQQGPLYEDKGYDGSSAAARRRRFSHQASGTRSVHLSIEHMFMGRNFSTHLEWMRRILQLNTGAKTAEQTLFKRF
ncbi:hypothetical protein IAQ61_012076 [Plenodomus lingam]|uniref:Predicted protein n=1 Tax=Leptosphaeria maculans (strain JN3 / isolate v23.1.3 / race Av1-4-5-6-7-8) TaxID=985895 RepID=E5AC14_LEPMJ|nr:predicted protein [Plenodomus lingam JN3]KAH9860291.1 hypothetical protein IAQ61_012076 [Plenodomus lingam]CBY01205.1 predicted protein [Plenodomus lingam JN3]